MRTQAKITCPHCGSSITVREIDPKTVKQFNKLSGVFSEFGKLMG